MIQFNYVKGQKRLKQKLKQIAKTGERRRNKKASKMLAFSFLGFHEVSLIAFW
jgi:hypothetical protein